VEVAVSKYSRTRCEFRAKLFEIRLYGVGCLRIETHMKIAIEVIREEEA